MLRSDLFCIFVPANVERFDLIATTRKNAKPMLFPSVIASNAKQQSTTSHTN